MKELVFLLEELSAKTLLQELLPRMIPENLPICYIVFEGKQDLEKQLIRKLKGYINPEAIFIVLRDQDSADCVDVKKNLKQKCLEANKKNAIVRIACRELESWYLADLKAVEQAFEKKGLSVKQQGKKFRKTDILERPSEILQQLVPEYEKISGSRKIARFLDIKNTNSRSFFHFIQAIQSVLSIS